jgi:hypothetical protein
MCFLWGTDGICIYYRTLKSVFHVRYEFVFFLWSIKALWLISHFGINLKFMNLTDRTPWIRAGRSRVLQPTQGSRTYRSVPRVEPAISMFEHAKKFHARSLSSRRWESHFWILLQVFSPEGLTLTGQETFVTGYFPYRSGFFIIDLLVYLTMLWIA